jgi:hypothetical protein
MAQTDLNNLLKLEAGLGLVLLLDEKNILKVYLKERGKLYLLQPQAT